mmetsp:Transcript_9997/g.17639  ORF Transcript_9997/g.17639 Transcript_9997/m.17639 type:complete len:112 (+) Transcript_9997:53-388(+)
MNPNKEVRVRDPGANVRRFLAREEELRKAGQYVAEEKVLRNQTAWVESSAKNARKIQSRTAQNVHQQELTLMNQELKLVRKARLKEFYEELNEQYEKELNARGLSIVRDRL